MAAKVITVGMLLCILANAEAGTTVIGTATARGSMRIDGHTVNGDATLFDGTVIETDKASATLHLNKSVEIILSNSARTTLYRDRLVLEQGSSEWTGSGSFSLEANGLMVTASDPLSRGIVSKRTPNTIDVAAVTGELRVTNRHGLLLAGVRPGDTVSFAIPQVVAQGRAPGEGPIPMTLYGTLTKVDGRYYLALPKPDLGVVYELKGGNLEKLVGKQVLIKGTANLSATLASTAAPQIIAVAAVSEILPLAAPILGTVLVVSSIAVGAAAIGAGIFVAAQSSTPASR
jgi:hypothetical protein